MENRSELAQLLNIIIPDTWPVLPDSLPYYLDKLNEDYSNNGWLYYIVINSSNNSLVGDCSYFGKPDGEGIVEIGYSVVPELRNLGYAREMVEVLLNRAFSFDSVVRVIARTDEDNPASIKVLEKNGFSYVEKVASETSSKLVWEYTRSRRAADSNISIK